MGGITYKMSKLELIAFNDFDIAGDSEFRMSTAGYLIVYRTEKLVLEKTF